VDYRAAIDYLLSFTDLERGVQRSADPAMSLESMRSLLARLDFPQRGRKTVHITGSKGKGSTSAMIEGILRWQGSSTSLFTSPHLHSYTERIAIDGHAVSREEFTAGLEAIRPAVAAENESASGNVSTFGIMTALFFWLTRAQARPVDWQVVEVGLGGTFDTTNVFDTVDVSVITPISLEHTAILGNTCEEIARDKAGIIKPNSVCVMAAQRDAAAAEVIRRRCDDLGTGLVEAGSLYEAEVLEKFPFGQSFRLHGPHGTRELRTPMLGRHQVENAATAVAVADALRGRGHVISDQAIADGLARTRVPGRLEVMGQKPLILADGAHNGESAAALALAIKEYFRWKRCFLIVGTMRDKDVQAIGYKLARFADLIICTGFNSPRAYEPMAMVTEMGFFGPAAVSEPTIADALDTALSHAAPDDLILITGSLYLVAEARAHLLGDAVDPD